MDKALKQRLVGASVIIILAVIVLPMLLSGRSDRLKQESRKIELPPAPEELSFDTRRFPVGNGERLSIPNAREAADRGVKDKPVRVKKVATDSAAGKNGVANPLVEPLSTQAEPAIDIPRYLVQVASFSSEKKANELALQLKADKLSVLMDVVDRDSGRFHRVRVGPFTQRSEAEALVRKLQSQSKDLSPRVLDLHPDESTPVSTPADPLVRWVVQVGSFSDAKNADKLVIRLRQAGYAVFTEQVTSSSGRVFKVRIGPEIERKDAVALAEKVKTKEKIAGIVMTME